MHCPLDITSIKYSGVARPSINGDTASDLSTGNAVPEWAIAVIAVFAILFVAALICICVMAGKEKQGTPLFQSLGKPLKPVDVNMHGGSDLDRGGVKLNARMSGADSTS